MTPSTKLPGRVLFSAAVLGFVLGMAGAALAGDYYNIVLSHGQIGVAGNGFNELNAPYDSKVVGDYTGLTQP